MRARAAVVATRGVDGATRLVTLRSDPPLTLRTTAPGVVLMVASAAGPVGGDDLGLDVTVGPGAQVAIGSGAATVALPGPHPDPSTMRTAFAVGAGGSLWWSPQPTIAVVGCDHRATTTVALAADADLWLREEVVAGRHREPSGSVLLGLRVDRDGRPLYRGDLAIGPRWPGSQGPAGTAGAAAVGTALAVGHPVAAVVPPSTDDCRVGLFTLADDAWLVVVTAARPGLVRTTLDAIAPPRSQAAPATAVPHR